MKGEDILGQYILGFSLHHPNEINAKVRQVVRHFLDVVIERHQYLNREFLLRLLQTGRTTTNNQINFH
jgi:hypothetical protein